jgi:hypothetical protein
MKCTPLIFITVMTYLARCACDTSFFHRWLPTAASSPFSYTSSLFFLLSYLFPLVSFLPLPSLKCKGVNSGSRLWKGQIVKRPLCKIPDV